MTSTESSTSSRPSAERAVKRAMVGARRRSWHQRVLFHALSERKGAGVPIHLPLSPYDLAARLGVEVWFHRAASMEGLYVRAGRPRIIISAERPFGRQAFTCAHELGHHILGHGSRVEAIIGSGVRTSSPMEERLADLFAGFLLMPKLAVERAFRVRGFDPDAPSPEQVYVVAGNLGVGYSTLVHHMARTLRILPTSVAKRLSESAPKAIRATLLGREVTTDLWIFDAHWAGRPLDMQVGDVVLMQTGFEHRESQLRCIGAHAGLVLYEATAPGVGFILRPSQAPLTLRVSQRAFAGRYRYRFLEEEMDE